MLQAQSVPSLSPLGALLEGLLSPKLLQPSRGVRLLCEV